MPRETAETWRSNARTHTRALPPFALDVGQPPKLRALQAGSFPFSRSINSAATTTRA